MLSAWRQGVSAAAGAARPQVRPLVASAALLAGGLITVLAALWAYAPQAGPALYQAVARAFPQAPAVGAVVASAPLLAVAGTAALVWAGATVTWADAAARGAARPRRWALRSSLAAAPRALGVGAAWVCAIVAAILLTPLIVALGVLGLAARAIARTRWPIGWPAWTALAVAAVPGGAVGLIGARTALAASFVWLDGLGVRASLGASWEASRGRAWRIGASLLAAVLVVVGVTEAAASVTGGLGGGAIAEAVARTVAQLVVGGLPFVVLALARRKWAGRGADRMPGAAKPRPSRGVRPRVAGAMAGALLAGVVLAAGPAAPASADPGTASAVVLGTAPSTGITPGNEFAVTVNVGPASPGGGEPVATGSVTATLDGAPVSGSFALDPDTGGAGIPFASGLAAGSYEVVVTYPGDGFFAPSMNSITVTVGSSLAVTLDVASPSLDFGDSLDATATVTGLASPAGGTVAFWATPASGPLVDLGTATLNSAGVAVLSTSSLAPGDYDLTAIYQGDAGGSVTSSGATAITVTALFTETTATLTPASSPSTPSAPGGTVTAHVEVSAIGSALVPVGTVEIYPDGGGDLLGSGTLAAGEVDIDMVLPPGAPVVRITYVPGVGFGGSSTTEQQHVAAWSSALTLAAPSTSAYGAAVHLTATLDSSPVGTGSVSFTATPTAGAPIALGSDSLDGAGVAELDASSLAPGAYTFTAAYAGDGSVAAATSAGVAHTVAAAPATVTVTPASAGPPVGPDLLVAIEVTGPPALGTVTGTVDVLVDGDLIHDDASLTAGAANVSVPVHAAGLHTVTVEYAGDGTFAAGDGSADFTALRNTATVIVGGSDERVATYGDDVAFEGSVHHIGVGGTPSGAVQLWADGYLVGTDVLDASANWSISADDIPALASPGVRTIVARYLGSDAFEPADSDGSVTLRVDPADGTPVLTIGPGTPGVGGTYTLTATLPDLGEGATGTVTFETTTGDPLCAPGHSAPCPVTVSGGIATVPVTIAATHTLLVAHFSGDGNFNPGTSAVLDVVATRAAVTVELLTSPTGPGTFTYGATLDLVARVTVAGGGEADGLVTFRTAGGATIAEDVDTEYFPSLGYGIARVTVCAGDSAGCPVGMTALGVFDASLLADYPEGAENEAATSAALAYALEGAPTALDLVSLPPVASPGGALSLTATVTNLTGGSAPTGTVEFYAVDPTLPGGAEHYLGSAPLVAATATSAIAVAYPPIGAGSTDVRWPANAIVARYGDPSGRFAASHDDAPVTVERIGTSVTVAVAPAAVGAAADVTVTLSHDIGVSADYTGTVSVFVDGSTTASCTRSVAASSRVVTCPVTFGSVGDHTITASYAGDKIYAPSDSAGTDVDVDKAEPTISLVLPGSPVAERSVQASWNPTGLTGTVSITANGAPWCSGDAADGHCSGTFTNAHAETGPVAMELTYSGDANYQDAVRTASVSVIACRVVDVYSQQPALGTVSLSPASSCGTGGYPQGTVVTATSHPVAPNALAAWWSFAPSGPGMVQGGSAPTLTFTVTADSWTWTHAASFGLPCVAVTPQITGLGTLWSSVTPSCTTSSGAPGYPYGTTVTFAPFGLRDPGTGAIDAFYGFGDLPAGIVPAVDGTGQARFTVTLTAPLTVPLTFGPRCLAVTGTSNPADAGGAVRAATPLNCRSPLGDGFLPFTPVTVEWDQADSPYVVTSWSATGAAVTPAGPARATVALEIADVTVTADVVACYPVTVTVDGAELRAGNIGAAELTTAPTCPDGSALYTAGTRVTAVPELLVAGAIFRGWNGDTSAGNGGVTTGQLTDRAFTTTVEGPTSLTASFYLAEACSRISVFQRTPLVTFAPDGCGEGFYADAQAQWAAALNVDASTLQHAKYRTSLFVTKTSDTKLDIYASVRGDTGTCFGTAAPGEQTGGWRSVGTVGSGTETCDVGGPVHFRFEACQTLDPVVAFTRTGDTSGTVFREWDLPSLLYVRTAAGNFAPLAPRDFDWVKTQPMGESGGDLEATELADGACRDAGNAFPAGIAVLLGADSPTTGFAFQGWTSDASTALLTANPVLMDTDDTRPVMPVSAAYEFSCFHVSFGEGITILGDAPRCPGFADEDNMFIAGAAILVKADQHVGNRVFGSWKSGVITATSVTDPATGERTAFAYVSGDMTVAASYPTEGERWEAGFTQVGKVLAGVTAIVAPIVLGVACPPCGIALAAVSIVSITASLIPGGEDVAAFMDLINPAKILECTTNWGFNNDQGVQPTGDPYSITGLAMNERKVISYLKPPPTGQEVAAALARSLKQTSKRGATVAVVKVAAKDVLRLGAFAYSLYDAGFFELDLGYQNEAELRDTAGFKACLDDAYRFAG